MDLKYVAEYYIITVNYIISSLVLTSRWDGGLVYLKIRMILMV